MIDISKDNSHAWGTFNLSLNYIFTDIIISFPKRIFSRISFYKFLYELFSFV